VSERGERGEKVGKSGTGVRGRQRPLDARKLRDAVRSFIGKTKPEHRPNITCAEVMDALSAKYQVDLSGEEETIQRHITRILANNQANGGGPSLTDRVAPSKVKMNRKRKADNPYANEPLHKAPHVTPTSDVNMMANEGEGAGVGAGFLPALGLAGVGGGGHNGPGGIAAQEDADMEDGEGREEGGAGDNRDTDMEDANASGVKMGEVGQATSTQQRI